MAGLKYPLDTILLASATDKLAMLLWAKTKDGAKGRNKPEPILAKLLNAETRKNSDIETFDTPEDFEAAMKKFNEKRKEEINGK